ncbi:MAG: aldehyde dehydrogenase family protein, partial [Candidatus Hydrothermia bacterium]
MRYYKNFINGKWVDAKTDKTFESRNPANWDEVIGIFPDSSKEDLELAVESAKRGFEIWSKIPAPKRGEILRKAGEILLKRKKEIA